MGTKEIYVNCGARLRSVNIIIVQLYQVAASGWNEKEGPGKKKSFKFVIISGLKVYLEHRNDKII